LRLNPKQFYEGYALIGDLSALGADLNAWWPYVLLVVPLWIALGFEFVNGFHDTANAVATVIYCLNVRRTSVYRASGD
jgi:PiT family inorganic phosphate transporter